MSRQREPQKARNPTCSELPWREAVVGAVADFNPRMRMAELIKYAGTCDDLLTTEEFQTQRRRSRPVIPIDTSSWIHVLRPNGDPAVRGRVEVALTGGQACWCPLVRLKLCSGTRGGREREVLKEFAGALPELPINEAVWREAYDLARRARARGITVPASDLATAACARRHGAALETADTDLASLTKMDS